MNGPPSAIDEVLASNERYAAAFRNGGLPTAPSRGLAVVACMDARIDVHKLLGLEEGDAHVIRNAGGVVTNDTIRSLAISQRKLGTQEVMVIQHTGCGLLTFDDEEFAGEIEAETGSRPAWTASTFTDLDENVRDSVRLIRESRYLPHTGVVRGFVYDVETGALREVVEE